MSNKISFDFNGLKKMTIDKLIVECEKFVEQYLSKSAAKHLDKAYNESRHDEVKNILERTQKQIKTKIRNSEYNNVKKMVMNQFSYLDKIFLSLYDDDEVDEDERSQEEDMETTNEITTVANQGNGMEALIFIIVGIIVIGAVIFAISIIANKTTASKNKAEIKNKSVDEGLSVKNQKKEKCYQYTEKDRDLMELIHELAVIYDNTDKYMKS